jgi:hypothetical protein
MAGFALIWSISNTEKAKCDHFTVLWRFRWSRSIRRLCFKINVQNNVERKGLLLRTKKSKENLIVIEGWPNVHVGNLKGVEVRWVELSEVVHEPIHQPGGSRQHCNKVIDRKWNDERWKERKRKCLRIEDMIDWSLVLSKNAGLNLTVWLFDDTLRAWRSNRSEFNEVSNEPSQNLDVNPSPCWWSMSSPH